MRFSIVFSDGVSVTINDNMDILDVCPSNIDVDFNNLIDDDDRVFNAIDDRLDGVLSS